MAKVINIKQKTDSHSIIHFRNKDKTDLSLTDYAISTGKVIVNWRKKGSDDDWMEKEIAVYDATTGRIVWTWTTTETTDLLTGEYEGEFLLQKDLVAGEYIPGASEQIRFPNNLKKYQKIFVIESAV